MKKASDIMTTDVITLSPETDIIQAARTLLDKGINGAPVIDGKGELVGILCQSDLVFQQKQLPLPSLFTFLDMVIPVSSSRQMEKEVNKIAAMTVAQAMSTDPVTVTPDTGIDTIATLMVDKSFHTLPVVENNRLVGVIGKEDVLKTLLP